MSLLSALTAALAFVIVVGCLYLFIRDPRKLRSGAVTRLSFIAVPSLATYKLIGLATIGVLPAATLITANLDIMEGAKTVESCSECHVMQPMVSDMMDPASDSLAARHYRGPAMQKHECYTCHAGYGFRGALAAKLEGYRHLVRYTTKMYQEPIRVRGHFDSKSCLSCHDGTEGFEDIRSHRIARERLTEGKMSCTNCHGLAHPSRTQRTPGSSDYERLMHGVMQ